MPQLRNIIKKRNQKEEVVTEPSVFPMRINKYLALKNYSTRRGADEFITSGKVFINGQVAKLGDKVLESDKVEVRYRKKALPTFSYFAYNKPVGMNTGKEKDSAKDIISSLPEDMQKLKLFPVGRLDKDSQGLIIITNDGRVTDRLLNPKHEHIKEYEVVTTKPLRESFKEKIEEGIDIEGYKTKPASAKRISDNKFSIVLTEGKTHQIRRMVSALFNEVKDLKRTKIMNIKLGTASVGSYRKIEGDELNEFLKGLGLE
jgi:23S rRNA pseudouridine2604 synthase